MLVTLTTPPDERTVLVRSEAIIGVDPPFAWSPTLQARVVKLTNGQTIIVMDSAANMTALRQALAGTGGSVQPAPAPIGGTPDAK